MSEQQMTQDQFNQIMQRFETLERHMVTKSDVHGAVFQGFAVAAACIVGYVVVLIAIGAFS